MRPLGEAVCNLGWGAFPRGWAALGECGVLESMGAAGPEKAMLRAFSPWDCLRFPQAFGLGFYVFAPLALGLGLR